VSGSGAGRHNRGFVQKMTERQVTKLSSKEDEVTADQILFIVIEINQI
jgi:hypothetical protein